MQTKCTNILFNIIRDDYLFIYGSKIKIFFPKSCLGFEEVARRLCDEPCILFLT